QHPPLSPAPGRDARHHRIPSWKTKSSRGGGRMSANHRGNGHHRNGKDHKVRVAIVGVGNCASSLVQGVHYYRNASAKDSVPGLMHVNLGGYHIRDIEFVAAFDIDKNKVGLDLSEAIFAKPNNTVKFSEVPKMGLKVQRGMTHDGIGKYLSDIVQKAPGETSDVVGILRKTRADVVVSYLPVGSEEATKWYVEQALTAGVGFVNCIPRSEEHTSELQSPYDLVCRLLLEK